MTLAWTARRLGSSEADGLPGAAAFASLRDLVDSIPTPVLVKDQAHVYFALNREFTVFFSRTPEEIVGKTDYDFFDPVDAAYYQRTDDEALHSGRVIEYEHRYDVKGGSRQMLVRKSRLILPDGRRFVVLVLIDVTRSVRLQEEMRRKQDFYAALCATNRAISRLRERNALFREVCEVAVAYCHFRLVWVGLLQEDSTWVQPVAMAGPASAGFPAIRVSTDPDVPEGRGYTSQALRDNTPQVVSDYFADARVAPWAAKVEAAGIRSIAAFPLAVDGRCIGSITFYGEEVGFFTDELVELLSEMVSNLSFALFNLEREAARAAYEQRLIYLAHHDHLTGLPNRVLFSEQLRQHIALADSRQRPLALVFVDLDHFKAINESLGHVSGDELLRQVAGRVEAALHHRQVVARLDGDEFAFLLDDAGDREATRLQVREVLQQLAQAFHVGSKEVFVTASAGVALYPDDGDDVDALMKNADVAMHHAKHAGRMDVHFFESQMKERAVQRLALEGLLRRALSRNEFALHYQPRVDVLSGETVGVEALLRWHHPDLGDVSPSRFIPILEENGLILPLGEWVVGEACRQLQRWIEQGIPALNMSINISARQLQHKGIEQRIADIVTACGVDPRLIELELTESVLMHKPDEVAVLLGRIKQYGMRISVDDFGTGYSSLSYLKRFPLDVLKIDRSFVKDMLENPEDIMIIRAIVAMARSLRLKTVAEGVESSAQFNLLAGLGCDEYQGYLASPPLPGERIATMLRP